MGQRCWEPYYWPWILNQLKHVFKNCRAKYAALGIKKPLDGSAFPGWKITRIDHQKYFYWLEQFVKPGISHSYSRKLQKLVCVFYKIGSSQDSLKKERPDLFRASIFLIPATIKFHQGQGPRQSGLVKVTGLTPALTIWLRKSVHQRDLRQVLENFGTIEQHLPHWF